MSEDPNTQPKTLARIPKRAYSAVIIKCEGGESKSKRPMLTLELELRGNKPFDYEHEEGKAETIDVNSHKLKHYIVLDGDGPGALNQLGAIHRAQGLAEPDIDNIIENRGDVAADYIGAPVRAIINSREVPEVDEADGEPILDDDGNPIIRVFPNCKEIIGVAKNLQ